MSSIYWAGLVHHGNFRSCQYSVQLVDESGYTLITLHAHTEKELKENVNCWLSEQKESGKMYMLVGEYPRKSRSAK